MYGLIKQNASMQQMAFPLIYLSIQPHVYVRMYASQNTEHQVL